MSSSSMGGALPVRFYLQLQSDPLNKSPSAASASTSPSASAAASVGTSAIECHTHAMSCYPTQTFDEIRSKIWSKKGLNPEDACHYTFRLVTGEMTFDPSDTFERFLELNETFRESESGYQIGQSASSGLPTPSTSPPSKDIHMLECLLLHVDHLESKHVREKRASTLYGVIQHRGTLTIQTQGMLGTSWKQRHAILQDMQLVLYDHEDLQRSLSSQNFDTWSLGSVIAVRYDSNERNHPYGFELQKPLPPNSTLTSSIPSSSTTTSSTTTKSNHPVFYVDSEHNLQIWIHHINRLHLRRTKLIVVTCVEELESRGLDSSEGLFRVSGNKSHVELLQQEYDKHKLPNLGLIDDEHILTSFLKNNLRNLPEPLTTFELYPEFIKVIQDYPLTQLDETIREKRIGSLLKIVKRMPETNQGLLEYLMSFLHRVTDYSESNKMTPTNLAIVFAPNLLRPRVENVASIMAESKFVQDVVETFIRDADSMWTNFTNTRRTSRLAFFNVRGGGGERRSPQPPPTPTLPSVAESHNAATHDAATTTSANRGPPPRPNVGPPPLPSPSSANGAGTTHIAYVSASGSFPPPLPRTSPPPIKGSTPPPLLSTLQSAPSNTAAPMSPSVSTPTSNTATTASASAASPPPLPKPTAGRLSFVQSVVSAAQPSPVDDLSQVVDHCHTLMSKWSTMLSNSSLPAGLTNLLAAHSTGVTTGTVTPESSAEAAATVQRCLGILSADMLRFELDMANLARFVTEQTKLAQNGAAAATTTMTKAPTPIRPPPLPNATL